MSSPKHSRYTLPIIGSLVLHIGVIVALLVNVQWGEHDEEVVLANVIDAEVVEPGLLDEVENKEQARRREQERLQQQAEQQRRREEQAAEEAAERKAAEKAAEQEAEQEAERKKKEEALRIAEEKQRAEAQRLAEQKEREEEQRKEEQRRKAEQERMRREMLAEERRLREQAEQAEWERLQKAEEQAKAQARSRELATKMQLYKQAIKQRVDRNWIRPVSAEDWYTCEVVVDQIPGGEIVNVQFNTCDGDSVFQRSVRNAVYKSSPLPDPPDSALFERRLNFTFRVPGE